jgi:predicted cobalt transporter CbtA
MRYVPLATILRAALVAGLAAGLTVSVFHLLVTEPVIQRAITLEAQAHGMGQADEAPLVSRDAQRVGLVVGFLLYGLTWALLLGATCHLIQRWFGESSTVQRWLLALAGFWAVGLFPFLKYPANPPGVGDPETIGYRQSLYLGLLVLSVAGTAVAAAAGRYFGRSRPSARSRWLPALAFLAVFSVVVYAVMPGNPDDVRMPPAVVASFQALSLVGLTLFWAVLGFLFGKLPRESEEGRPVARASAAKG